METAATKALIIKTLTEAFDACVKDWNLSELEHKNLANALYGPETINNIYDVMAQPEKHSEEGALCAHIERVSFPSGKDIQIVLSVARSVQNRLVAAEMSGSNIIIRNDDNSLPATEEVVLQKTEQLDIEEHIDEMEDDEEEVE